jgi:predicted ribosomally synthesized peptide with SipW-like signal peptide
MRTFKGISPLVRAVGVFSAVAVVVGGVTFAAFNSQATLTSNTISTATANLQVYDTKLNVFSSTGQGFTITDLVPGTGVTSPFYLKNAGGIPLAVTAHIPAAPAAPPEGYGFTGFENVKVTITSDETGCTINTKNTTMAKLLAGEVALPCNPLAAGAQGNNSPTATGTEGNYKIKFDIDPAAITGNHAGVGAFDLVFTGTQATATPPPDTLTPPPASNQAPVTTADPNNQ